MWDGNETSAVRASVRYNVERRTGPDLDARVAIGG